MSKLAEKCIDEADTIFIRNRVTGHCIACSNNPDNLVIKSMGSDVFESN